MRGLCDFCGKSQSWYNHDGCTLAGEAEQEMLLADLLTFAPEGAFIDPWATEGPEPEK